MEQKDVIERMQKIMSSDSVTFEPDEELVDAGDNLSSIDDQSFVESLPQLSDDEFVLVVEYENIPTIVCVEELDWITTQNIEISAHRKSSIMDDKTYFAGEYECREILRRAIHWVADVVGKEIKNNADGDILSVLPPKFVDTIWNKYYPKTNLTAKEANALYKSALDYFTGEVEKKPVPPIVIEVDMILKMGSMTRKEIRAIKNSEMQRIKIVLKARAEALQLQAKAHTDEDEDASEEIMKSVMDLPKELRPPVLQQQGGFTIPK